MSFFSEPYWWAMAIGAAVLFGIYCRMGVQGAGSPFKNLIRTGFVSLAAVSFMLTGWRGGLGACVGGALVGYLVPTIFRRTLVRPVAAVPSNPASRVQTKQLPLGRRALVRDMILNGISRQKVWRLVQIGLLTAWATLTTLPVAARRLFGIPDAAQVVYCIPLGYPRGNFGPAQRKPLSEVCSYDRWVN